MDMCARNQALDIFSQAYKMCGDLFADKLTDAYLYGSYARGDYDDFFIISKEEVEKQIAFTEKFVAKVKEFLENK